MRMHTRHLRLSVCSSCCRSVLLNACTIVFAYTILLV